MRAAAGNEPSGRRIALFATRLAARSHGALQCAPKSAAEDLFVRAPSQHLPAQFQVFIRRGPVQR